MASCVNNNSTNIQFPLLNNMLNYAERHPMVRTGWFTKLYVPKVFDDVVKAFAGKTIPANQLLQKIKEQVDLSVEKNGDQQQKEASDLIKKIERRRIAWQQETLNLIQRITTECSMESRMLPPWMKGGIPDWMIGTDPDGLGFPNIYPPRLKMTWTAMESFLLDCAENANYEIPKTEVKNDGSEKIISFPDEQNLLKYFSTHRQIIFGIHKNLFIKDFPVYLAKYFAGKKVFEGAIEVHVQKALEEIVKEKGDQIQKDTLKLYLDTTRFLKAYDPNSEKTSRFAQVFCPKENFSLLSLTQQYAEILMKDAAHGKTNF